MILILCHLQLLVHTCQIIAILHAWYSLSGSSGYATPRNTSVTDVERQSSYERHSVYEGRSGYESRGSSHHSVNTINLEFKISGFKWYKYLISLISGNSLLTERQRSIVRQLDSIHKDMNRIYDTGMITRH